MKKEKMKKNEILGNITISKLIFWWKWLALAPDGKKIIISGWAIPWSVVNLRILRSRSSYYEWQIVDQIKKSLIETELPSHFQVYWWCKWLPIRYEDQLAIKNDQVKEAFNHIKEYLKDTTFHEIIPSPEIYGYRNKVEFSFWKYISAKEWVHDEFRFWFHKQGEFDRIIDCSFCVLASDEVNSIFKEVDNFARKSSLPTYDPKMQRWFWRHFVVRQSNSTGALMLIFSINSRYEWYSREHEWKIRVFLNALVSRFPKIESIYLLYNTWKADIVAWEYELVFWKPVISEKLLWKEFEINPKSFFQTNSLGAEKLYDAAIRMAFKDKKDKEKWRVVLDLYAGTWTLWILFSSYFEKVYSVELVKEASEDWERNAKLNWISNIEFVNAKVEDFLKNIKETGLESRPVSNVDLLIIDPPRDGMHPDALPNIIDFWAELMVYVSCNPATLARDLDYIVKNSDYKITDITPVDMFPHTHHIETVVRLEKK